jgi:hypothetical protein
MGNFIKLLIKLRNHKLPSFYDDDIDNWFGKYKLNKDYSQISSKKDTFQPFYQTSGPFNVTDVKTSGNTAQV